MTRLLRATTGRAYFAAALLIAVCALIVAYADSREAGVAAAGLPSGDAQNTASQECAGTWQLVSQPNPRTHHYLRSVDALAPDDIWAVGRYYDENGGTPDTTLTMHWDGTAWNIVSTAPIERGELNGVDAISPNDVWAVGHC